jgi:hypothetical protein
VLYLPELKQQKQKRMKRKPLTGRTPLTGEKVRRA